MTSLFARSIMVVALIAPVAGAVGAPPPDPQIRSANARGPEMRASTRPPLRVIKSTVGPKVLCCSRATPLKPTPPKSNPK
jgi:hypothetical protein